MGSRSAFHPYLSSAAASDKLVIDGSDGIFLLRRSSSNPGRFTITVRFNERINHINIFTFDDCFYINKGEYFACLHELIQYYVIHEGLLTDEEGVSLPLHQICYARTCLESRLSAKNSETFLMQRGDVGSFLVRESKVAPGKYVLTIKCQSNAITHVPINNKGDAFDIGESISFGNLAELIRHYTKNPVAWNPDSLSIATPLHFTLINAKIIHARVMECKREMNNSKIFYEMELQNEFDILQEKESEYNHSRIEGAKRENISKNRYPHIIPYDYSRVILEKTCTNPSDESDYINANYIKSHDEYLEPIYEDLNLKGFTVASIHSQLPSCNTKNETVLDQLSTSNSNTPFSRGPSFAVAEDKVYIATQGCLQGTVADFWKMIWQENCQIIVLITREVERDHVKTERYWPLKYQIEKHGKLNIHTIDECLFSDYTLREFNVSHDNSNDIRKVAQYHFLGWPDFGVPDSPKGFLSMILEINNVEIQKISQNRFKSPLCVQCSTGISRTGTFIALDILINQLKTEGINTNIDIHETVCKLREQRSGMVPNIYQYKFIYDVIDYYTQILNNEKDDKIFDETVNNLRKLSRVCYSGEFPGSQGQTTYRDFQIAKKFLNWKREEDNFDKIEEAPALS